MFLLAALLLAAQSEALPALTLKPSGEGTVIVAEPFASARYGEVTAELKRRAQEKCGTLAIRWGRYNAREDDRVGADGKIVRWYSQFDQKFFCYDPAHDPYRAAPAGWTASARDNADATATARRLVDAIQAGQSDTMFAAYEPMLEATRDEIAMIVSDFRTRMHGEPVTYIAPKWLVNPQDAGHPGAYAYVVFTTPHSCGYFALYRVDAGKYQVSQQQVYGALSGAFDEQFAASLREQCSTL